MKDFEYFTANSSRLQRRRQAGASFELWGESGTEMVPNFGILLHITPVTTAIQSICSLLKGPTT